jgi:D-serine dehydratase
VTNNSAYLDRMQLSDNLTNATHLVWATGGGMVPEQEMTAYLQQAKN